MLATTMVMPDQPGVPLRVFADADELAFREEGNPIIRVV